MQVWQPRITVGLRQIMVEIQRQNLWTTLLADKYPDKDLNGAIIQLTFPVQLKRSGIETRLIETNGEPATQHRESTLSLQNALHEALTWNDQLLSGEARAC